MENIPEKDNPGGESLRKEGYASHPARQIRAARIGSAPCGCDCRMLGGGA